MIKSIIAHSPSKEYPCQSAGQYDGDPLTGLLQTAAPESRGLERRIYRQLRHYKQYPKTIVDPILSHGGGGVVRAFIHRDGHGPPQCGGWGTCPF